MAPRPERALQRAARALCQAQGISYVEARRALAQLSKRKVFAVVNRARSDVGCGEADVRRELAVWQCVGTIPESEHLRRAANGLQLADGLGELGHVAGISQILLTVTDRSTCPPEFRGPEGHYRTILFSGSREDCLAALDELASVCSSTIVFPSQGERCMLDAIDRAPSTTVVIVADGLSRLPTSVSRRVTVAVSVPSHTEEKKVPSDVDAMAGVDWPEQVRALIDELGPLSTIEIANRLGVSGRTVTRLSATLLCMARSLQLACCEGVWMRRADPQTFPSHPFTPRLWPNAALTAPRPELRTLRELIEHQMLFVPND